MLPILPWSEASDACRGREIDVQFPRSTDENLTRAIGKLRVASLHDTSLPMSECPRAALPRSHCSRHEDTNAGSVVLNLHPVPAGGSNRPLLRGAIPVGESIDRFLAIQFRSAEAIDRHFATRASYAETLDCFGATRTPMGGRIDCCFLGERTLGGTQPLGGS